jgi:mRNA interferase MazF
MVRRGEVWLVGLDPTIGREIRKTRPALVVSPDDLNDALDTVLVAPMTTGGAPAPFHVPVTFESKRGLILAEQIRAVDKQRLLRRAGRVAGKTVSQLLLVFQEMFAE